MSTVPPPPAPDEFPQVPQVSDDRVVSGQVPDGEPTLSQELADLQRRLQTQPVIEQAKGILMSLYAIDADAAFAVLRRWSMNCNTRLSTVSALIVSAASRPVNEPFEDLREAIERLQSGQGPELP